MKFFKKINGALLLVILSILGLPTGVEAGGVVFNVTRTDDPTPGPCDAADCSLREAILDSNFQVVADDNTINLQAGAVYTLSRTGAADDTGDRGDLDIFWNTLPSGTLTINGNGATIDATLINERVLDAFIGVNLVLNDLTLSGGLESGNGGGMQFIGSGAETLAINRCSFTGNQAANGGGMNLALVTATINASTISGNEATSSAGGIQIGTGSIKINNSTISNNTAGGTAGGLSLGFVDAIVRSSTISSNAAGDQGGGVQGGFATLDIKNSILSGNSAVNGDPDCGGGSFTITSNGYNIFGTLSGSCVPTGPQTGDQGDVADPLLGALANNGGPTLTRALLPGGQALDGGDPNGCQNADDADLLTDQRGELREADGDGNGSAICDIGAFEVVCGDGFVNGEEACDDGNTSDGDCCDSACAFEPSGNSCDDGNAGTTDDQCDGAGLCEGTPTGNGGCSLGNTESAWGGVTMLLILSLAIGGLRILPKKS